MLLKTFLINLYKQAYPQLENYIPKSEINEGEFRILRI